MRQLSENKPSAVVEVLIEKSLGKHSSLKLTKNYLGTHDN
jgi:hypothetical protein